MLSISKRFIACFAATTVLAPLIFMLWVPAYVTYRNLDNNPGIAAYFAIVAVLAIPLGLINAVLFARAFAFLSGSDRTKTRAIVAHLILQAVFALLAVLMLICFERFGSSVTWMLLPFYLIVFLSPALTIGSLLYSITQPPLGPATYSG